MARNRSNMANKDATRHSLVSLPRLVSDENGRTVEVILGYEDYRSLLARHADWETLPRTFRMRSTTCWPTTPWLRRERLFLSARPWQKAAIAPPDALRGPAHSSS
jgi:hypothetical protein